MYALLKRLVLTGASVAIAMTAPSPARAATRGNADSTTVTVQNDRRVPVTVYAEEGDFDHRLGTVGPDTTATLRLPAMLVHEPADIQIFVDPKGEFDLATQDLTVNPGSHLGVLVPSGADLIPPAAAPMMDPHPDDPGTSVTVRNDRHQDVVVYLEHGDFDTRIGSVPAQGTATLRIPSWLADRDGVDLVVHPEGGFDLTSSAMRVRKGEHLGIVVPTF